MGWLELKTWLRVMNKQQRGGDNNPHSWEGKDNDEWWAQMDEERKKRRGW